MPASSTRLKQRLSGGRSPPLPPLFELKNHDGTPVRPADLQIKGPLVICFFRGRWCPFCVGQLEAMNLILPQIEQAGASLVAISPQTVQQSFFMGDQHQLRFPLLSDAGNQVAQQFGLAYRVPDYQQAIFRNAFINLPFANGDDGWKLPIPATYIVAGAALCSTRRPTRTTPSAPNPPVVLRAFRPPTRSSPLQLDWIWEKPSLWSAEDQSNRLEELSASTAIPSRTCRSAATCDFSACCSAMWWSNKSANHCLRWSSSCAAY